jgi:hypothetical protein
MSKPAGLLTSAALVANIPLSGCAYGYRDVNLAPSGLGTVRHVRVEVINGGVATPDEVEQMKRLIEWKLRDSGRYAAVESGAGPMEKAGGLRVVTEIVDINRVTGGQRAMVGAFAGRGWIRLRVYLYDGATDEQIGDASIEGFSSGGTVFAGTTSDAMDEAAEKVVEFVGGEDDGAASGV